MKSLLAVCLSVAALTASPPAQAADLKVLVAQVVEPAVKELGRAVREEYRHQAQHRIRIWGRAE
jgi:hypothetical protein